MDRFHTRRGFLHSAAAAGAALGLSGTSFLKGLRPVSAGEARLDPQLVQLRPEIEPTVRLLEETPRERLLEVVAARVKRGLSYQELLAALMLAGVRNVMPRPSVGFKFHAVLVVNSAHLASLASPDSERWLPIFWSLDYFKEAQALNLKEGQGRMQPVEERAMPPAHKARQAFQDAMDRWDEKAADAAAASLARHVGMQEAFEIFCRIGARDFRDIGHKAIYVANSCRTLQCIGWQHAEPILRSLAHALNKYDGANPAKSDQAADRPWRRNRELAKQIRPDWQEGKPDAAATAELLATLRQADDAACCKKVVELLNKGVAVQSVWDGLFDGAGELLVRQPGIVALHAVTSTNALHYAYQASGDDDTRKMMLLQNAAFVALFRQALSGRGKVADHAIDHLEPLPIKATGPAAVEEIMADVGRDSMTAARKTLAYLRSQPDPRALIDAARLMIFFKGNNSHDYKFSSAVLEDFTHVSPAWRDRYLAASMFQLRGSSGSDNRLVQRTRAALAGVGDPVR